MLSLDRLRDIKDVRSSYISRPPSVKTADTIRPFSATSDLVPLSQRYTMQFTIPQVSTLLLTIYLTTPTSAADCNQSGPCLSGGATRDEMYAARQEVCSTDIWKEANRYNVPGTTGYLRWTGVDVQQTCWDAFDDIINQCHLGDSGFHTHAGQYEYNGFYWNAVDYNV